MAKERIVVFGANGRVGRLVVEHALTSGYRVVAFVHHHHDFPDNTNLSIVQGDIYKREDVEAALKGADVVISALGSWGTPKKDVLYTAMNAIIPAMKELGMSRIISLTGSEARATGDALGIIHRVAHVMLGFVAGKILRDGERHIQLLEQSGLDWVVIRSPIMLSSPRRSYRLDARRPRPWATISRQAVAYAILRQVSVSDASASQEALYIH